MAAQKIIIAGGTGFIGVALSNNLIQTVETVVILTRSPGKRPKLLDPKVRLIQWDGKTAEGWAKQIENARAIINLAGAGIASGLWTAKRKNLILQSRLNAGRAIVAAVNQAQNPPQVVVQASGIGYYGSRGNEKLTESAAMGTGYLPEVARQWEAGTQAVTQVNTRHIILRLGIVLGPNGGFLSRIKLPFYFFMGGHFGSGKQWLSWIHRDDLIEAIKFLIAQPDTQGVFNISTPNPVPAAEFSKILGKNLKRPSWFHIPAFFLRLGLGDMANELLLPSQRVIPERLIETGYKFKYPELKTAFSTLLKQE